jgi:hypothetical protein
MALIGLDTAINIIFFGDIIVNMISAYKSDDYCLETDQKVI